MTCGDECCKSNDFQHESDDLTQLLPGAWFQRASQAARKRAA
jgi:hypothetical protein